jgi:tetratricopeptide (TPR) repeat protein
MKQRESSSRRSIAFFAVILCSTAAAASARAQMSSETKRDIAAIWNDPVFQKQFVGSYGINAEIEPRVTPDEVKILEKVRPLMADNLPAAEAQLSKSMKPDCSAILDFTLGSIQFQQENRMSDALANYRRAVEKFPSFRRAWRNLGLIHAHDGRNDDAIRAFTRMIELGGGDGYSYGLLAFAYAAKQDWQAAEGAYRNALLLQPEKEEWRFGLTRCAFKQQKFEDAAALLDGLLELYPQKSEFWLLQANTFLGMKQPLKAAENLEVMDFLGKATVDSQHTLGDIYVSENLMDMAARAYLRAIDVDASQSAARPVRSTEVLMARGALSQARVLAERIDVAFKDRIEDAERKKLLKIRARLSMSEGGSSRETVQVLEEVVELDPLDGEALLLLGQHYARNNEHDRAMFWYERAASIEAFEVNAKVRHAQVLVGLGRYNEAVPLLRRAQEVKPRDDIARYIEQIQRLAKR